MKCELITIETVELGLNGIGAKMMGTGLTISVLD